MSFINTIRTCFFATLLLVFSAVPDRGADRGNFISVTASAATAWEGSATVTTRYGGVRGFQDNFKTWVWKAIPYAKPPIGELRWQAPQDPEPWSEIRDKVEFCNQCLQFSSDLKQQGTGSTIRGNEDCLYLNIWRPQSAEHNLPVYFWIHGGGNTHGSADPFNGAAIASQSSMVVVTINYRLGPFGWFTHPALRDAATVLNRSGNYATLDIIKALEWVRDNIDAFGGNPQNVTIAGQSAGGVNVFSLMISPVASDLFHRAISQSGSLQPSSQKDGDAYANKVIESLLVIDGTPQERAQSVREAMSNTEIKAYLRSKTAEEFFAAVSTMKSNPAIFNDGAVIQEDGADALDDPEKYNQVPIIIGSTSEEAKLFMFIAGLDERWNDIIYQRFAKRGSQVARITGLDTLAQKMSVHESQPGVYSYIFVYGEYRSFGYNAWPTDSGPTDNMSWAIALGAFHSLDIAFNFGMIGSFPLFGGVGDSIFREDNRLGQQALSNAMMTYTAQFARTGNPNTGGLPEWTKWPSRKGSCAPKFILFDANDKQAIIQMSTDVR